MGMEGGTASGGIERKGDIARSCGELGAGLLKPVSQGRGYIFVSGQPISILFVIVCAGEEGTYRRDAFPNMTFELTVLFPVQSYPCFPSFVNRLDFYFDTAVRTTHYY